LAVDSGCRIDPAKGQPPNQQGRQHFGSRLPSTLPMRMPASRLVSPLGAEKRAVARRRTMQATCKQCGTRLWVDPYQFGSVWKLYVCTLVDGRKGSRVVRCPVCGNQLGYEALHLEKPAAKAPITSRV
jgi:hypothetical protein